MNGLSLPHRQPAAGSNSIPLSTVFLFLGVGGLLGEGMLQRSASGLPSAPAAASLTWGQQPPGPPGSDFTVLGRITYTMEIMSLTSQGLGQGVAGPSLVV